MNRLHRYISDPGNTFASLKSQASELYGSWANILEEGTEEALGEWQGNLSSDTEEGSTVASDESVEASENQFKTVYFKDMLRIKMMREFIAGMENRFVPFRRWHMLTSEQDIVHNGIVSSEASVVNHVMVQYLDFNEDTGSPIETTSGVPPIKTLALRASSHIPENMLNTAVIDYANCKGYSMALRYGQSALMFGLREMYKGEIMLLGNPRIRPWDVCLVMDSYNDMAGPIEVESVVHMFSHETGYLTEIKPNAVVIANEISTWPILEAIKLFAMAVKSQEENGEYIDALTGADTWYGDDMQADPEMIEYFNRRYSAMFGNEHPLNDFVDSLQENKIISDAESVFRDGAENSDTAAVAVLAGAFGAAAMGTGVLRGLRTSWKSMGSILPRNWNKAHFGSVATGGVKSAAWVLLGKAGVDHMTSRTAEITQSGAWLVGMPILFSKCLEEETVNVVPLMKGNRPIVSGLTLKSPTEMFNSILGNITNAAEDTMNGMTRLVDEWEVYKNHSWAAFEEVHQGRNAWWQRYIHEGATMFDWAEENL